jgi:hypothetical protein
MQENSVERSTTGRITKIHRYIHSKEHNVLNEQNISTANILFDFLAEKAETNEGTYIHRRGP